MSICCPHSRSASKFFSFFAKRCRKRFIKKGFEKSQEQLVTGLRSAGFDKARLLEIGSGVGYLHQTLLGEGAASATGIDLSPKMIAEATQWAEEKGMSGRTHYIEDDFINIADCLDKADVTILDKVVCCYPDADSLVHKSLALTRRVYALTYPRNRWFLRLGAGVMAAIFSVLRIDFRSYIHDPEMIEAWIIEEGFRKRHEECTTAWLTQVYVNSDVSVAA